MSSDLMLSVFIVIGSLIVGGIIGAVIVMIIFARDPLITKLEPDQVVVNKNDLQVLIKKTRGSRPQDGTQVNDEQDEDDE